MKGLFCFLFVSVNLFFTTNVLRAQTVVLPKADSLRNDVINKAKSQFKLPEGGVSDTTVKNVFKEKPGNAKSAAKNEIGKVKSAFSKNLSALKKQNLAFNLTIESDNRYQPLPTITSFNPKQKFVSAINVIGGIQAWGIPLNFNYSTNQNLSYTPSALTNNLFKFDFDPRQFTNSFKSDIQQYYQLRSRAFGGLDLSSYTSQKLLGQIGTGTDILKPGQINAGLAKYIGNAGNMGELLNMDETAMRQKLMSAIASDSALNTIKAKTQDQVASIKKESIEKATLKQKALTDAANMDVLKNHLNDKAYVTSLDSLPKADIVYQLSQLIQNDPSYKKSPVRVHSANLFVPIFRLDIDGYVNHILAERDNAHNEAITQVADNIIANRKAGDKGNINFFSADPLNHSKSEGIAGGPSLFADQVANSHISDSIAVANQIDSVVANVSHIKAQLQANGYDVKQLLQMQEFLSNQQGGLGTSEFARNILAKKPGTGLQTIFSKIKALKLGAFGNKVPGNIQSRDLFMNGGHVTIKSGGIPVTLGYGAVNDIGSFKDAEFQNSVYNTPKNLTYIGAEFKRSRINNLKVSVVSGLNTASNNSQYAMPTISSNTVAFTLSKSLELQKAGRITVDVSKSTTLYANKFTIGSEAVFDKKGGMSYDLNNDLFEALAFGFNHHLDIEALDLTDNFYFNYAGMGYQNPANNGYSGARMRMGGNVKKSFYKNKLTFNLRSDLKNMPISYTSNDKWKTLQLQLDSRYIINKKFNVNVKYTANGTNKQIDNVTAPVYSFKKLQFDGHATYKIGKNYTVSHLSVGSQSFSNNIANIGSSASNMLLINYTQSLILKRNTLTATVLYNKELSAFQLIGNLLNSDVSYQYTLFNKVNLSSGITYLENSNIAQQVGIRQTLQLYASKNFDVDTYIDMRKNLITPQYADLYASCRAEIMLRYHINNK